VALLTLVDKVPNNVTIRVGQPTRCSPCSAQG